MHQEAAIAARTAASSAPWPPWLVRRVGPAPGIIKRRRLAGRAHLNIYRLDQGERPCPNRSAPLSSIRVRREACDHIGSLPRRAAERCCKPGSTAEQSPNVVAEHARSREPFEQPRRAGQRVDQDADHAIFDLLSGKPPALRAIRSTGFAARREQIGHRALPTRSTTSWISGPTFPSQARVTHTLLPASSACLPG